MKGEGGNRVISCIYFIVVTTSIFLLYLEIKKEEIAYSVTRHETAQSMEAMREHCSG